MEIIGAMNKEREYLSFRAKGEEPYHLVDAVKEFGFESLKQYGEEKIKYVFAHTEFEVVNTTPEEALSEAFKAINNKTCTAGFVNIDNTLVLTGTAINTNFEYCTECNIPVYPYYTNGGSIVATDGDFMFGIIINQINGTREFSFLLEQISYIFKKYSEKNFTVSGNDILMDGKKVLGCTVYKENDMVAIMAYLTFSEKKDLIEKICLKHSTKQPGHIDFMTRDDFCEEVKAWLRIQ